MNARWYDPAIGRFVSADTIVPDATNPQSFNRFSYTFNNPIRYTDPSGHDPICVAEPAACENNSSNRRRLPPLHEPETFFELNWVRPASSFNVSATEEPKPDFPIAVPWSREIGDNVSYGTDIIGIAVSAAKSGISIVGLTGYATGGGGFISDVVADEAEDFLDYVSIGLDIIGEVATGKTRTVFDDNNEMALVIGQDLVIDGVGKAGDMAIPSSTYDLANNLVEVGYGVFKVMGFMPNTVEFQISNYEKPNLVVYMGEYER